MPRTGDRPQFISYVLFITSQDILLPSSKRNVLVNTCRSQCSGIAAIKNLFPAVRRRIVKNGQLEQNFTLLFNHFSAKEIHTNSRTYKKNTKMPREGQNQEQAPLQMATQDTMYDKYTKNSKLKV